VVTSYRGVPLVEPKASGMLIRSEIILGALLRPTIFQFVDHLIKIISLSNCYFPEFITIHPVVLNVIISYNCVWDSNVVFAYKPALVMVEIKS